jgi:antibiotic biosynthesis monooxygenase (ABM) superfamily enzyme
MAVKILIKRKVVAEKVPELMPFLKKLRALALKQPAYISGETLKRMDVPGEYMVISTWESFEAWQQWLGNQERLLIQGQVDTLLGEKTEYAVYQYG